VSQNNKEAFTGVLFGASAYLLWGFSVIYWKWLKHIGPLEVVAHRVLWAAVLLGLILRYRGRFGLALALLKDPRSRWILAASSALLAVNWSIFVWSVMTDQILQASLGYYINPLLSILIGFAVLGETMNRVQTLSVLIVAIGVTGMLLIGGSLPWPALALAITFAAYGYLRKIGAFVAIDALFIEMLFFVPVVLGIIFWIEIQGPSSLAAMSWQTILLLLGAGVITFAPLWCFGEGVARTRLTTMGLLQFIAPTTQFILAVWIYSEPFTRAHIFAFACIWLALAIYSGDLYWRDRRLKASLQ
jgi:chloramphenicol-sensitive protein RarD